MHQAPRPLARRELAQEVSRGQRHFIRMDRVGLIEEDLAWDNSRNLAPVDLCGAEREGQEGRLDIITLLVIFLRHRKQHMVSLDVQP